MLSFERRPLLLALCLGAGLTALSPSARSAPDQTLGANDIIDLSVFGSTRLTNTFRIDPNGLLHLPLVQSAIPVKGLLPDQLAAAIANELIQEKLLVKPVVRVTVLEFGERPVTVIGAVRRPLTFQIRGEITLLDALARAEGVLPEAGLEILITRENKQVLRAPMRSLLTDPLSKYNYTIMGGEEIRVPEYGHVYVMGNVRHPGEFPMHHAEQITLLKLMAQAGGETAFAKEPAYLYRLDSITRTVREIELPLKRVLKHQMEDITLQPDDIIYVPEAAGRRLSVDVISRIVGPGVIIGADWLLDRR